jgi:hypothetical protein
MYGLFSPQQQLQIQPPLNIDVNPLLEQAVLAIQREYTADTSNAIFDNETKEYFQSFNIATIVTPRITTTRC